MLVPETPARDESETQFETTIISTCEDHGDPVVIPKSEMDGFSFELEQDGDGAAEDPPTKAKDG